jgi:hypothetical protein
MTCIDIRQRDRHRSGVEIEHRRRVEGIAIEADDRLLVDRCGLAAVMELADAAFLDDIAEVKVAFGPDKVVGRDGNGRLRLRMCFGRAYQCQDQRESRQSGFHGSLLPHGA